MSAKTHHNLAARMGRWSADHWKTATFGWLAFVVAAFALGMAGTKTIDPNAAGPRESGRMDRILDAGFDRAGVATLEPSRHGEALRRWLERGEAASMDWIGRRVEERLEPASRLPGARSALCVALRYWPLEGEEEPEGDLWPRVARNPRGEDNHGLMQRRHESLGRRIAEALHRTSSRR